MERIEALAVIGEVFPEDPLVLTCGATSREMASLGRRANHFYVVDSMGLVSSITLGLALGLERGPFRKVVGVEGDGGILMNLNSLATAGYLEPSKFLLVVLDNEAYASTGGQPTFTTRLALADIASACRLRVWRCRQEGEFRQALGQARDSSGPGFINLKISPGNRQVPYLAEDPAILRYLFESYITAKTQE
ncbi:MAG: phosphonopyruvate decarboxylase [Chloroflexi bacterium]|nr:phosphonopyruvate decarboxylase [Chloroflexota bacterium]